MQLRIKGIGALMLMVAFCAIEPLCHAQDLRPTESELTRATASLLQFAQFAPRPLDDSFSANLINHYVDALDPRHLLFLQSDLDLFACFCPGLAPRTLLEGDTRMAHIIYNRYLERLGQKVEFSTNLLQNDHFDFTGNDTWQSDRHTAPAPVDLAAARELWRAEVRRDYLREKLAGLPTAKIAPNLARRYERGLKYMHDLSTDGVLDIYLDSLAHVYDPHSDYFGRKDAENFNIELNLSLYGLGGTLKMKNGYCVVNDLIPGGPAARSGRIKPGDRIVAVAQDGEEPVDVVGMPSSEVVDLIRGPKGSKVQLTLIPAGANDLTRRTVSLVRDEIDFVASHARAFIIDLPQKAGPPLRLGVIDLPVFYEKSGKPGEGASADTARLIMKLKREGVSGLILDLRRNGGGSLEEAIRLAGLFIPSGPVVQVLRPEKGVEVDASPQNVPLYDGPLVVLTSRLSASASEIVAGALQDYGRALMVGDSTTFGKGTVQAIVPLKEVFNVTGLGAVNVTIGKFYRPGGASTQIKGVKSDIVLPSETDQASVGEAKLPNPLPWDSLAPAAYPKFNLVRPFLPGLREKSAARVASNPGFRLINRELLMAENEGGLKPRPLNENLWRRAREDADKIVAERKNVDLAESEHMPATYDITMANVDAKGLPPPRERELPAGKDYINLDFGPEIELRETENILADYIHALPRPEKMLGVLTAPGPSGIDE